MMKPTDFAKHLTSFFSEFLPGTRNLSSNTILSYRDTFKLFLAYCRDNEKISAEKLRISSIEEKLLMRFLDWLQIERGCSVATRNVRLAAIHSFFRYVQSREPALLFNCQHILNVPFKKCQQPIIRHMTPEQIRDLLAAPGFSTRTARRDTTLLSVLYDTGARVQELCDLRVRDVRIDNPSIIGLTGKGRKTRHVPIVANTVKLLRNYMDENGLLSNGFQDMPLFMNQRKSKLTRGGISHILSKYASKLAGSHSDFLIKPTPHCLRHSKAMHMYQAGVNLIYIRDFLGHTDISVTDTYARADIESKRKALEAACPSLTPAYELPDWSKNHNLLEYLNNL